MAAGVSRSSAVQVQRRRARISVIGRGRTYAGAAGRRIDPRSAAGRTAAEAATHVQPAASIAGGVGTPFWADRVQRPVELAHSASAKWIRRPRRVRLGQPGAARTTPTSPRNWFVDGGGPLIIRVERNGSTYTIRAAQDTGLFATVATGAIEARIRLPLGQGIWPAFWMLGTDFGSVGWPRCGEIDIMENIGQRADDRCTAALHGPGYSGGNSLTGRTRSPERRSPTTSTSSPSSGRRHASRWYVDGKLYQTARPRDCPAERRGSSTTRSSDPERRGRRELARRARRARRRSRRQMMVDYVTDVVEGT